MTTYNRILVSLVYSYFQIHYQLIIVKYCMFNKQLII